uniref:Uncharacterized protein n=1 Tax=mine drainage metagenome TaxID=410659 RepID=E6QVB0_9ZZZZ
MVSSATTTRLGGDILFSERQIAVWAAPVSVQLMVGRPVTGLPGVFPIAKGSAVLLEFCFMVVASKKYT